MGFLKKLFGGGEKKEQPYVDKTGIYFYVQVDNLDSRVKVRADRQHDLMRVENGYEWHKTIVDSKYFKRMQAVVHFDSKYNITSAELEGGTFITRAEYEAAEAVAQGRGETAVNVNEVTDDSE